MDERRISFAAVVVTAIALAPAGAHLFALPNKIAMTEHEYFVAQSVYRGWALLAVVLFAAIASDALLAFRLRHERSRSLFAALGAVLLCANLAIFFTWTFPANQATRNWTVVPPDWQTLRAQWEYSHAANFFVVLAALACVSWAATGANRS